jgi:hypothetical protein
MSHDSLGRVTSMGSGFVKYSQRRRVGGFGDVFMGDEDPAAKS